MKKKKKRSLHDIMFDTHLRRKVSAYALNKAEIVPKDMADKLKRGELVEEDVSWMNEWIQ